MTTTLGLVLAQAGGAESFLNPQLLILVGIVVVFYFFMIRPQQKRQKEQRKFLAELKKGDSVVTLGGMHGKIVELTDKHVTMDVGKGVTITFERGSISYETSKQYLGDNKA